MGSSSAYTYSTDYNSMQHSLSLHLIEQVQDIEDVIQSKLEENLFMIRCIISFKSDTWKMLTE